jgi:vacuole membrane protein 1
MHIQKMFVIFIFSQHHLDNLFELISKTPYVGHKLQALFQEWLDNEKHKLHHDKSIIDSGLNLEPSESILSWLLNKIVLLMVVFFVVSIINSLAQRRYKRLLFTSNKVAND